MEQYKIGYVFLKKTGEFTGTEIVYIEKASGEYPHADNVTLVPPPKAGEHEKQVWTGKAWKIVNDFRGLPIFNSEGIPVGYVEELGELKKDIITTPPPQKKLHEELKWDYEAREWLLTPEKGYKYSADGNVIDMNLKEKIEAGLFEMPDGYKFKDDDELIPMTQEELLEAGKITVEDYNEYVRQQREAEYKERTDKLGLMVLRGEATQQEWLDAILAVKEKWPYKE